MHINSNRTIHTLGMHDLEKPKPSRTGYLWLAAITASAFGLFGIVTGSAVVLDEAGARQMAGNYIPFILWFNWVAGLFYVVAGVGLALQRTWSAWLSILIFMATASMLMMMGIYISAGEAYEIHTLAAMFTRLFVWLPIAWLAWRSLLWIEPCKHALT